MASGVKALRIQRVTHRTMGRKEREDQVLCMEYPGGSVFLEKRVLEAAGDSWERLRTVAAAQAERHGVPFTDETVPESTESAE